MFCEWSHGGAFATRKAELTLGSDHPDTNRLALAFRILLPFPFCLFLFLERLRKQRKLPAEVLEEEPPLNWFGHEEFIA